MKDCWEVIPQDRPKFRDLLEDLERMLNATTSDVSNIYFCNYLDIIYFKKMLNVTTSDVGNNTKISICIKIYNIYLNYF